MTSGHPFEGGGLQMPPPLPSKLITRANGRNGKPPTMPPPLPNSTSAGPPPLPVREEMPAELAEKKRALELLALFTPYSKQHKLDPDTIATTIRMFDLEGEGELRQFLKIVLKMQAIFRRKLAWKQLVLDSFNMEDSEDDEDGFGVDEESAATAAAAPISFNARDGVEKIESLVELMSAGAPQPPPAGILPPLVASRDTIATIATPPPSITPPPLASSSGGQVWSLLSSTLQPPPLMPSAAPATFASRPIVATRASRNDAALLSTSTHVCVRKCQIRRGFEMESEKCGVLKEGQRVVVLEQRKTATGSTRVKLAPTAMCVCVHFFAPCFVCLKCVLVALQRHDGSMDQLAPSERCQHTFSAE